jgi:peptidoglycan-N-acetylglucosamine deacetylase
VTAALGSTIAPSYWAWWLASLAADHLCLSMFGMWPRSRLLGPNVSRLPHASADRAEVALTFDDGPDPEVTPLVLDLLGRHGAKATFFCIGERASKYPQLVRHIHARGHSVQNHTQTHPYSFACRTPYRLAREISEAQRAIFEAGGVRPRFFRAPAGLRSPLLDPVLAWMGLQYVSWTRRGLDGISRDPNRILERLLAELAAGDILLLHDGSCTRTLTGKPVVLAVLPTLLQHLTGRGLRSVSLTQAFPVPTSA